MATEGFVPSSGRVAVCADDYGYRRGVSAAILRLALAGRIGAASALVTFPDWPRAAADAAELRARADLGLHLNLVQGAPLGPMPRLAPNGRLPTVGRLIALSLAGRLDRTELAGEIGRQLDAFAAATGTLPDFVDGHQHAHALPVVRDVLLGVLRGRAPGIAIRDPSDRAARIVGRGSAVPKALLVAALARGMRDAAARRGSRCNDGFSGFSAFAAEADLAATWRRHLAARGPRHLVMCHPGDREADEVGDPIAPARSAEAAFLASEAFAGLLAGERLAIVRQTAL